MRSAAESFLGTGNGSSDGETPSPKCRGLEMPTARAPSPLPQNVWQRLQGNRSQMLNSCWTSSKPMVIGAFVHPV